MPIYNIIIFGEPGAGKSSVVNMFAQGSPASIGGYRRLFQSEVYDVCIGGTCFRLHDITGLGQGELGGHFETEAIARLYQLLCRLEGGLSLLICCCFRRLSNTAQNWKLFREIICQNKVPVILAITGLEMEENMDDWWPRNKAAFDVYSISE